MTCLQILLSFLEGLGNRYCIKRDNAYLRLSSDLIKVVKICKEACLAKYCSIKMARTKQTARKSTTFQYYDASAGRVRTIRYGGVRTEIL